jgi:hypothetical protein
MTTTVPDDAAQPLAAALGAALDAVSDALAVPTWRLGDGELVEGLQVFEQLARLAAAGSVRLAAQAQQRGLPGQGGHRRLSGWVQAVLPTATGGEAHRLARRAEVLFGSPAAAELAPTREALLAGEISGSQADAITDTLTALLPPVVPAGLVPEEAVAESQTLLLDQAEGCDASALRKIGQRLHAILDPDADDRLARDEAARDRARGLTLSRLASGMVHVDGLLTPRCGQALTTAIDAWSAPQPSTDGTPDPRTGAQRRHDGLHRLVETVIAAPGLLPSTHGSPYRVLVTVDQVTLAAALADQPMSGLQPALLPDDTALSSTALAEIACGADLVPVLVDDAGNPLDVGDTQYAFPARQRTAIALRDRHCTYPGCTAPPAWCDTHHLTPFSRGGPTAVTNATLLCGRHHRHVHTTGLTGHLHDGSVHWTTGPPGPAPTNAPTRATHAIDHLARRWRTRQRQRGFVVPVLPTDQG